MKRHASRPINGILLLDKPGGITSQAAVARVKRLLSAAKAGHTGTLDPAATGLLPVCLGEATKFSHLLLDADKGYRAAIQLGRTTTTGDLEGDVIDERPVSVTADEVHAIAARFRGELLQKPPMYSALKHAGKPLYRYARDGVEIDRAPRRVHIGVLDISAVQGSVIHATIRCSKGTYIRVLAEDIGRALGCGACLAALTRTSVGDFRLEAAIGLAELEEMGPEAALLQLKPTDALLEPLPRVDLDDRQQSRLSTGQAVALASTHGSGLARLYGPSGFLGVGRFTETGTVEPARLLAQPEKKSPVMLEK